jgi:hypothetical protein
MNYLTDKYGVNIDPWNPLAVNDVSISYDKISVTGETVTFVTGAAGFSQSVAVERAPIMNLLGDRVGSFWRQPQNKRCTSDARMGDARVTALVETATSATVTIWDPDNNLEQLFESPAATAKAAIVVRDDGGNELYGFIGAVAATGNSYVLDIYNSAALSTQSWVGTLADFTLAANSTQFEIYSNESSISWTTGTVLTTEVLFPEGAAHDPQALTEFLTGLSNGEYGVDYEHGLIHYKKATTGTSDTIAYSTKAATSVSITASGGSGGFSMADDAAFTVGTTEVNPAGYLADETATDSVDEGDIGAPRMTLNRRPIGAAHFLDDGAFTVTTDYVNATGFMADQTSTDSVDEGDIGIARMTLDRKQIMAGYDSAADANKNFETAPIWANHVETTLADVTNETSATNYYYVDMDGYQYFTVDVNTSGTTPSDTLTITIEAGNQDDGTAAASIFYQDVTTAWFGVASVVDADLRWEKDTPTGAKYVRIKTVTAGGSNDADYAIYFKKWY